MFSKLFSFLTSGKAFRKGFREGKTLWRYGFFFGLTIRAIKFLFSKPEPKTFQQYDLEPGEYRVVVKEHKK